VEFRFNARRIDVMNNWVKIAMGMVVVASVTLTRVGVARADIASGWALSHNLTGTFSPRPLGSFNSSGGPISISNTGTGLYTVTFTGLGAGATSSGNVQVGGFDFNSTYCNVNGWGGVSNIQVFVACYSATGIPTNAQFVVHYQRGINSYIWSVSATSPAVGTCCSRVDSATPILVSRSSVGKYAVFFHQDFGNTFDPTSHGGNVVVSGFGSANHCKIQTWVAPDGVFNVFCFSPSGAPADSVFTLSAGIHGALRSAGVRFGFAFDPTNPFYVVPPQNPNGPFTNAENTLDYNRFAVGRYFVEHSSTDLNAVLLPFVTAVGARATYCKVDTWVTTAGGFPSEVDVDCCNANGTLTNEEYIDQLVSAQP
jgi:hypothetical protein